MTQHQNYNNYSAMDMSYKNTGHSSLSRSLPVTNNSFLNGHPQFFNSTTNQSQQQGSSPFQTAFNRNQNQFPNMGFNPPSSPANNHNNFSPSSLLEQSLLNEMAEIKQENPILSDIKEEPIDMDTMDTFPSAQSQPIPLPQTTNKQSNFSQNFFDPSLGNVSNAPMMTFPTQMSTQQQQQQQQPFSDFGGYDSDHSLGSFPASPAPIHAMTNSPNMAIPQRIVNRNSTHGMPFLSSSVPVDISGMNMFQRRNSNISLAQSPQFHSGSYGALDTEDLTQRELYLLHEKRRKRRESHNAVERRRRDNINEKIQELGTLLPEELFEGEAKPNKALILKKTVDYLRTLQDLLKQQEKRSNELEQLISNDQPNLQ